MKDSWTSYNAAWALIAKMISHIFKIWTCQIVFGLSPPRMSLILLPLSQRRWWRHLCLSDPTLTILVFMIKYYTHRDQGIISHRIGLSIWWASAMIRNQTHHTKFLLTSSRVVEAFRWAQNMRRKWLIGFDSLWDVAQHLILVKMNQCTRTSLLLMIIQSKWIEDRSMCSKVWQMMPKFGKVKLILKSMRRINTIKQCKKE